MTTKPTISKDELASEIRSLICDWNSPNHLASNMDATSLKIADWYLDKLADQQRQLLDRLLEQGQYCYNDIHDDGLGNINFVPVQAILDIREGL